MNQINAIPNTGAIEKIIKETDTIKTNLESNILSVISTLLDYAFRIAPEKGYYPNLSEFYPTKKVIGSQGQEFTIGYFMEKGGIYMLAYDPTSHCQDTKESHTKKVSKREFLGWVKKSNIYALDVYEHLIKYIKAPTLRRADIQRTRELHTKYI